MTKISHGFKSRQDLNCSTYVFKVIFIFAINSSNFDSNVPFFHLKNVPKPWIRVYKKLNHCHKRQVYTG